MLSKSQFRLGLSCLNKIYFKNNKEYVNQSLDDPFLQALASGGFQIEAYARKFFPTGVFIEDGYRQPLQAIDATRNALEGDCVLFEAAFGADDLFALTDIVVKQGNTLHLIEVKSKSYAPDDSFLSNKGANCASGWKDYLFDLAFQTEVAKRAYPNLKVFSSLFLVDKTKKASIDGLSQLIRLPKKDADVRKDVEVGFQHLDETGERMMIQVEVSEIIDKIIEGQILHTKGGKSFSSALEDFLTIYQKGEYPNYPTAHAACKKCEFKTNSLLDEPSGKSGFAHCFKHQHDLVDADFKRNFAFELYDGRLKPDAPVFLNELTPEILGKELELSGKMSRSDRQLIQIEKVVEKDESPFVMLDELAEEMSKHEYPLHFIDFEAGLSPLPAIKNVRPYEHIPFQFSHHIMYEDGRVVHHNQVILADVGQFPNFEFARALKKSLGEKGTIFRYHRYENTVLRKVRRVLVDSSEDDKDELIAFIDSITKATGKEPSHVGERNMVDLFEIIKNYYYDPATKGSNSIKAYLPAFLKSSSYLQDKYSKPIKDIGLNSLNDPSGDTVWVKTIDGEILDPYKQLTPLFEGLEDDDEIFEELDLKEIKNGGAALVAYAYLQYVDLPEMEREAIIDALYRYCELDTLAMVMIYEGLREIVNYIIQKK